jgi:hypothetical protein
LFSSELPLIETRKHFREREVTFLKMKLKWNENEEEWI